MFRRDRGFRTCILVATILSALVLVGGPARGALVTIEPDNFPDRSALTNVSPYVTLNTLDTNNEVVPMFTVTATGGDSATTDLSPTGTQVFAHFDIPFFNVNRKLQADFNGTTSSVSIAFAGGTPFTTETGRLEIYGEAGNLLDTIRTAPTGYGQFATLSVTRPTADIVRAVAYSENSFGRLDALSFETPVPEPSAGLAVVALSGAAILRRRRAK
jgi:hypothetical protein